MGDLERVGNIDEAPGGRDAPSDPLYANIVPAMTI